MAKGDRIYIGMTGSTSGEIIARQNGRSVTSDTVKDSGISWLVVQEVTRGGTVIEEIKVQLSDVMFMKTTKKEK